MPRPFQFISALPPSEVVVNALRNSRSLEMTACEAPAGARRRVTAPGGRMLQWRVRWRGKALHSDPYHCTSGPPALSDANDEAREIRSPSAFFPRPKAFFSGF